MPMEYLNQFHKESTERKMKKIQESKNFPTTYETVMQQQKRREQLVAHQEVTEAKMKSIEEWRKHPMTEEEMDRIAQEHFDAHGQINPNKNVNPEITAMENQIRPDWITQEQWSINPNIHHWKSSRKAMESLKQSKPVTTQEAQAQFSRLRNEKNWGIKGHK